MNVCISRERKSILSKVQSDVIMSSYPVKAPTCSGTAFFLKNKYYFTIQKIINKASLNQYKLFDQKLNIRSLLVYIGMAQ